MHVGAHQKLANLEVAPDTELVVHVNLTDGHPLVIGTNTSQLAIREAGTGWRESASGGTVVTVSCAGLPRLVGDLQRVW